MKADDPAALRRQIDTLKREIASIDRKHNGTAAALAARRQSLSRLEARLAMCESAPVLA